MKAKQVLIIVDKTPEAMSAHMNEKLALGWQFCGYRVTDDLKKFTVLMSEPCDLPVEISREAGPGVQ
jgi:hypothetical protein